jgi:hypothetical protein
MTSDPFFDALMTFAMLIGPIALAAIVATLYERFFQ